MIQYHGVREWRQCCSFCFCSPKELVSIMLTNEYEYGRYSFRRLRQRPRLCWRNCTWIHGEVRSGIQLAGCYISIWMIVLTYWVLCNRTAIMTVSSIAMISLGFTSTEAILAPLPSTNQLSSSNIFSADRMSHFYPVNHWRKPMYPSFQTRNMVQIVVYLD